MNRLEPLRAIQLRRALGKTSNSFLSFPDQFEALIQQSVNQKQPEKRAVRLPSPPISPCLKKYSAIDTSCIGVRCEHEMPVLIVGIQSAPVFRLLSEIRCRKCRNSLKVSLLQVEFEPIDVLDQLPIDRSVYIHICVHC